MWHVPASPAVLPTPPAELVHAVALSPDGRMAALGGELTGGNDPVRTAEVWDLRTMRRLASFSEPPVGSGDHQAWLNVSFSRDGRLITGASDTGRVHVWDWSAGRVHAVLSRPGEWFRSSAFTPDGSIVAATASDRTIWLWQWRSGRVIGHLREGHSRRKASIPRDRLRFSRAGGISLPATEPPSRCGTGEPGAYKHNFLCLPSPRTSASTSRRICSQSPSTMG